MKFEDTQTANKPMERWSTPLVIREMQHHSEIPLCTREGGQKKKEVKCCLRCGDIRALPRRRWESQTLQLLW